MKPIGPAPLPPVGFPVHLNIEAEQIMEQMKDAVNNQGVLFPSRFLVPWRSLTICCYTVQVVWDAVRYSDKITPKCNGQNPTFEEQLKRNYPPIVAPAGSLPMEPTLIVDRHQIVLAWYLPRALNENRQVS